MKRTLSLILLTFALDNAADDIARRKAAMDQAQEWKDDLKDALDAKDGVKAADLARKIALVVRGEQTYWIKLKQDDAQKLAVENQAAARDIVLRAQRSEFPQAQEAYTRLENTCRSCHDLHPEKRAGR